MIGASTASPSVRMWSCDLSLVRYIYIYISIVRWSTPPGACARLPRASAATCVLSKGRTGFVVCHSRQDNETPCKSNRPVVYQANAFDSRLRGSRSTASIPSTVNELSFGVSRWAQSAPILEAKPTARVDRALRDPLHALIGASSRMHRKWRPPRRSCCGAAAVVHTHSHARTSAVSLRGEFERRQRWTI